MPEAAAGQGLSLRVLGSGTCELRAERSAPAYLVTSGRTALLLDLGQGGLRRMLQAGQDPAALSAVLISHHHLDHLADLIPLLFSLNYDPNLKAKARLELVGHQDLAGVLAGLEQAFGDWLTVDPARLKLNLLRPGQNLGLGDVRIRTAAARHMASSLAYRLDLGPASLVYLGDSEPTEELARLAQGAGLLVANCAATPQEPKPGHMDAAQAGQLAATAGVGGLLLSHLYSQVDPAEARDLAAARFSGPVWAARDHMELRVGPAGVSLSGEGA